MNIVTHIAALLFRVVVIQRSKGQQVGSGHVEAQTLDAQFGHPSLIAESITNFDVLQAQVITLGQPERRINIVVRIAQSRHASIDIIGRPAVQPAGSLVTTVRDNSLIPIEAVESGNALPESIHIQILPRET